MIVRYYESFLPECDCCGHLLAAEHSAGDAEAAMEADGWHKIEGKDLCRLCWQHYEETGRMPRKLIYFRKETDMKEASNKKDLEEIEAAEGCADACPVEDTAGTETCTTAEATTSLSQDMIHAVANETRRREGVTYHSAYESYAILSAVLEIKAAVEKDLKKAMSELWDGVKAEDDDVVSAYLQNIARVARESAMAWVRVAAIAEKAGDEL